MSLFDRTLAGALAGLIALGPAAAAPSAPAAPTAEIPTAESPPAETPPAETSPAETPPAAPPPTAPPPAALPPAVPPPAALARPPVDLDALEDAYETGYDRGVGVPLMVWGGIFIAMGALLVGAARFADDGPDDELDDTDYSGVIELAGWFTVLIGAAQFIPGLVMFSDSDVDRDAPRAVRRAHAAGYDHGVGNALLGYGVVFALSLLSAMSDGGFDIKTMWPSVAMAGLHIGLGVNYRSDGISAMKALTTESTRERSRTAWQGAGAVEARIFPVARFEF